MSIASISSPSVQSNALAGAGTTGGPNSKHEACVDLRKALRSGDLDAARTAFARVEKSTPKSVSDQPNSATAQMRTALASGDLQQAEALKHDAIRESRMADGPNTQHLPDSTPPNDWPVPTGSVDGSTGSIGSLLSVSA